MIPGLPNIVLQGTELTLSLFATSLLLFLFYNLLKLSFKIYLCFILSYLPQILGENAQPKHEKGRISVGSTYPHTPSMEPSMVSIAVNCCLVLSSLVPASSLTEIPSEVVADLKKTVLREGCGQSWQCNIESL